MNKQSRSIVEKIVRKAASSYNPMERVPVRGPFEGIVSFSDGSIYRFENGRAMIHRKNLYEAYNIGCSPVRAKTPTT